MKLGSQTHAPSLTQFTAENRRSDGYGIGMTLAENPGADFSFVFWSKPITVIPAQLPSLYHWEDRSEYGII